MKLLALFLAAASAAQAPATYSGLNLHNHSYCSDGQDTPETLVAKAKAAGIRYLGLTDHDNVECLSRARAAARQAGLNLVAGIEVSTEDDSIHLLGLHIRPSDPEILSLIRQTLKARLDRARAILAKLRKQDIPVSFKDLLVSKLRFRRGLDPSLPPYRPGELEAKGEKALLAELGELPLTRPDIARLLIEKGVASDHKLLYDKYLGENGCCGVPLAGPSYRRVIDAVHRAGGIVVLAHPYTLHQFTAFPRKYSGLEFQDFESLAGALLDAGLDGFEQYKQRSGPEEQVLKVIADFSRRSKRTVYLTPGSDYHGDSTGKIGPAELKAISIPQPEADKLLRVVDPLAACRDLKNSRTFQNPPNF